MTSMTNMHSPVTGGVDTHRDTLHAAAIDAVGRELGDREFPTTPLGYRALLRWLRGHGTVTRVGVEGTGAYGAGLSRYLRAETVSVVEVDRPDRAARRAKGKSDPIDAYAAARAAMAGTATGTPKSGTGRVEAIRALRIARRSAIKARTQTMNQLKGLLVTAPAELRETLRGLSPTALVIACARLRPGAHGTALAALEDPTAATKTALRSLARRHQHLTEEISDLDADLLPLLQVTAADLLAVYGVGPDVAGQLLVTAGDNPERLSSENTFAHLCGVAPIHASSGQKRRYRLNRGGDRRANNALYTVVLVRLAHDPRTRAYAARRTTEGLSKKDIIRCLKRYVAREVYPHLLAARTTQHAA